MVCFDWAKFIKLKDLIKNLSRDRMEVTNIKLYDYGLTDLCVSNAENPETLQNLDNQTLILGTDNSLQSL